MSLTTITPPDGGGASCAREAPSERVALTPRPGRSRAWVAARAARGTWFLVALHVGGAACFFVDVAWWHWVVFAGLVFVRGMATTVGLHRYFSHRAFKTSRVVQFLLGCVACTNLQRGPLWWAAIHRHHHRHSDEPDDAHSPVHGGLFWAHCGWTFATVEEPDWRQVADLRRFPELVWLERAWLVPPLLLVVGCWLAGGWGLVCVGFCLSGLVVLHGAFLVNSLGHVIGSQRYPTGDSSRNSFVMALLTFGDGWHHNHHHYPRSANHGFFWWEVDASYRFIRLMELVGLVWDVRGVPAHKLHPPGPGVANAGR